MAGFEGKSAGAIPFAEFSASSATDMEIDVELPDEGMMNKEGPQPKESLSSLYKECKEDLTNKCPDFGRYYRGERWGGGAPPTPDEELGRWKSRGSMGCWRCVKKDGAGVELWERSRNLALCPQREEFKRPNIRVGCGGWMEPTPKEYRGSWRCVKKDGDDELWERSL